jgi:hypothetical protein
MGIREYAGFELEGVGAGSTAPARAQGRRPNCPCAAPGAGHHTAAQLPRTKSNSCAPPCQRPLTRDLDLDAGGRLLERGDGLRGAVHLLVVRLGHVAVGTGRLNCSGRARVHKQRWARRDGAAAPHAWCCPWPPDCGGRPTPSLPPSALSASCTAECSGCSPLVNQQLQRVGLALGGRTGAGTASQARSSGWRPMAAGSGQCAPGCGVGRAHKACPSLA